MTGGSTSTWKTFDPMRKAGAAARAMLIARPRRGGACRRPSARPRTGVVTHARARGAATASSAEAAAELPRRRTRSRIRRTSAHRQADAAARHAAKVNGKARVRPGREAPGDAGRVVARAAGVRRQVKSFDADKAKAVPGVAT